MLSAFSKSQSKGIQMLIQQIYSRVLRALVLIVTLTILSSAFLKGDESSSPLPNTNLHLCHGKLVFGSGLSSKAMSEILAWLR